MNTLRRVRIRDRVVVHNEVLDNADGWLHGFMTSNNYTGIEMACAVIELDDGGVVVVPAERIKFTTPYSMEMKREMKDKNSRRRVSFGSFSSGRHYRRGNEYRK